MSSHDIENIKIDIFMYLWEMYHKSHSLDEFEERYVLPLPENKRYAIPNRKTVIREVLIDFYDANGITLDVKFNFETMELHKHIKDFKDNLYLHFLCKELAEAYPTLQKSDERDNLFNFDAAFSRHILEMAGDKYINETIRMEVVKQTLRKMFELDERDAIFFMNGKLFVRYFRAKIEGRERRFNGLPEKELVRLYEQRSDEDYKKVISTITRKILENELDLRKVDNFTFHKNYIRLYQNYLRSVFKNVSDSDEVCMGLVNYIFRQHFEYALMLICEKVLELVAENNENIKDFVNFYDGKQIVYLNKTVNKSEISLDGKRWSYNPIFNAVGQKVQAENNLVNKLQGIENIELEIDRKQENLKVLETQFEAQSKILDEYADKAQDVYKELNEIKITFHDLQQEHKNAGKGRREELDKEIERARQRINKLSQDDEEIIKVRDKISIECERLEIRISEERKQIAAYERNRGLERTKLLKLEEKLQPLTEQVKEIKVALYNAILKFRF